MGLPWFFVLYSLFPPQKKTAFFLIQEIHPFPIAEKNPPQADWYDMPHDVLARISNRIINEAGCLG